MTDTGRKVGSSSRGGRWLLVARSWASLNKKLLIRSGKKCANPACQGKDVILTW